MIQGYFGTGGGLDESGGIDLGEFFGNEIGCGQIGKGSLCI